jgi:hypothetical protein
MFTWPPRTDAYQPGDQVREDVAEVKGDQKMSKIEVDYVEPAPAGPHKFRVDQVEERDSEFGPRLVLGGEILEHGYPCSLWIPKPTTLSNPKTYLAKIYQDNEIDWKTQKTVDPTKDLPGMEISVELSYTDDGYARLKYQG